MITEVELKSPEGDNHVILQEILNILKARGGKSLDIIVALGPAHVHADGCRVLWDDSDNTACLVIHVDKSIAAVYPMPKGPKGDLLI